MPTIQSLLQYYFCVADYEGRFQHEAVKHEKCNFSVTKGPFTRYRFLLKKHFMRFDSLLTQPQGFGGHANPSL